MRSLKSVFAVAIAVSTLLFLVTPAKAQEPRYLHALSNLHAARGWLNADRRPEFKDARRDALLEIDAAINEVAAAAHDEGKSTASTPPPDWGGDPALPVHNAVHLLDDAYADVRYGTDIPKDAGLQARAVARIGKAREIANRIAHAH